MSKRRDLVARLHAPPPFSTPAPPPPPPPAGARFFADWSPWNTPAASLAEDPNSASIIAAYKACTTDWGFSGASYRPSLWTCDASILKEQWMSTQNAWFAENVPTPNFVIRSTGSEWHTVQVDTVRDMIFGVYYSGSQKPGTRNASGKVQYRAIAIYKNSTGSGWWNAPSAGPELASGGSVASMIRRVEIEAGVINHALSYAGYNVCTKNSFRAPATVSDGIGGANGIVEMGIRMAIKPSVNLATMKTALGFNNTQMIVIKALQDYGMFLCDSSSGNAFHIQNTLEGDLYDGSNFTAPLGTITKNILDYMHVLVPQTTTLDSPATWTPNNPHH